MISAFERRAQLCGEGVDLISRRVSQLSPGLA